MAINKQTRLLNLQDKYIEQLPARLDEINKAWLDTQSTHNHVLLQQLRQLAHNLAGSAGTFGFSSVSIAARNLEENLKQAGTEPHISINLSDTITDGIQEIISLVQLGPSTPSPDTTIETAAIAATANVEQLIYLIEDDILLGKEIAAQLQYFDYEVKILTDIPQAMAATKLRLPAAMIIDIQLSDDEFAGPDFALRFNEFSAKRVPMLFISARDDWQARHATVRAHGSAYLTKPLDFDDLLGHLDVLTLRQIPEPFRVLIIDDMDVLAEYYAIVLRDAGMLVETVSDINQLFEVLSNHQPELILMDVYMPQCSGLELAQIIRQKNELVGVPIVFLSTEVDPIEHLYAMELGGDDFLQKPISNNRLVVAVRARAQRFRELRSYMYRDGLTGLLNHITIKTQLETEIVRAHRQSQPLSFAMIDIDHFKHVNDTYGHPVGDRVIMNMARILTKRLRKSDVIGRYGGEEFAIILPETDIKTATKIIDDIRHNFSHIAHHDKQTQFNCTFSAGITQLTPDGHLNDLIDTADTALYEAKNSGRNKVCIK